MRHSTRTLTRIALTLVAILTASETAHAIPAFSRKYGTSCITCHAGYPKLNSVGHAFRRNGYQFPTDDESLVKDEPVALGNDRYKDMWPNALWPNDIPYLPPVSFRGRMSYNQFLGDRLGANPSNDFQFPNDFGMLTGGTLGKNISWYTSMVLAGRGSHGAGGGHGGGEEASLSPDLERMFVQFSNLFAWSDEEDDDGMRLGHRWITLPPHALNLRVGQFEPQAIAPWASIHRQLGTTPFLPNVATIGGNGFMFEPAQRGVEIHGILRQYNSYAIGLVNGNGAETAWDNNSQKDFYFRVARKWWGYPLDGVIGSSELVDPDSAVDNSPGEGETGPPGLDFWREMQFETGVFGYFGRNEASVATDDHVDLLLQGNGIFQLQTPMTVSRPDRFERVGFDARLQVQDLEIFGAFVWGWNDDPISDEDPAAIESDKLFTWFVEADYYFKPWLIGYCRYEELSYDNNDRQSEAGIKRAVIGTATYIRANVRLVSEFVVDAESNGTTADTFNALLDFAF